MGESSGDAAQNIALDRIGDAIVSLDANARITYFTGDIDEYLHSSKGTLLNSWIAEIAPDRITESIEQAQKIQRDAERVYYDSDLERWIELLAYPDDDGITVIFKDVDGVPTPFTTGVRAESAIECLPVAIGWTPLDQDKGFAYVNDAMIDLFDASSPDDLKKHPVVYHYVHPDDRANLVETLRTENTVTDVTVTLETLSGQRFLGAITASVAEVGGQKYALEVIRDVSARQETEVELERMKRTLERAPLGITLTDPSRDDNPLIYVNDEFTNLTGYDEEEILGRNCRFLQGEQTDPTRTTTIRNAIDEGEPVSVELRNYRKDGTQFWNHVTIAPVENESGEIVNFMGFQQDVTERKQYERELERQRNDLEILNQVVRHDIRNELQVILAYAEMLDAHVDDESAEHLDVLREAAENGVELTTTARDLAEVMLQTDSAEDTIALGQVLEQQVEEIRAASPNAVITLEGPLPDVTVVGGDLLNAVFRNLLKNAVQHNDKEVPEITVSTDICEEWIEVYVADNGPGIPDGQKQQIFGKGQKGLESAGTGIGLYLVRTLAEDYGGEAWVEDNDPEGAVFVVRLQRAG